MRNIILGAIITFLGVAGLNAQTRARYYDISKEVTIEGKVIEVKNITSLNRRNLIKQITVETKDKKRYTVELGPDYVVAKVKINDEVKITGSYTEVPGKGKLVLAREMVNTHTRERFRLRDENGFPQWSGRNGGMRRAGRSSLGRKQRRGTQ